MSIQTNLNLSAYKKAMLSVPPQDLVKFSKTIERNREDKQMKKMKSAKDKHKSSTSKSSKRASVEESKKKSSSKTKKLKKERKTVSKKSKKVYQSSTSEDSSDVEDLKDEVYQLGSFLKDRRKLLEEALNIVKGEQDLKDLVSENAKNFSENEIKQKFTKYLEEMSSSRIRHILTGQQIESSSDNDSTAPSSVQTNYIDSTTSHVIAQAFVTSSADEMRSETNEEFEELELIEEVVEEPFDEQVFVDDVTTIRDDDGVSEKMSQLEELEIRLRERAIKSLKKARNSS